MSFAPSSGPDGDRNLGEAEPVAKNAPSSAHEAPQRPAPMFVDPILVEDDERDAPGEQVLTESEASDEADVVFEADAAAIEAEQIDDAQPDEIADADDASAADPTADEDLELDGPEASALGDAADDEFLGEASDDAVSDADAAAETADARDPVAADEPEGDGDADGDAEDPVDEPDPEAAPVWRPAAPGTATRPPERDLAFGAATAAGLSTMTPVARVTEAPHRELGDTVLAVEGLTKRFGTTTAVDDVSFEVRKGSFFGIVGPNGAGKTTTLSMVTGMLRPTSGSATVLGVDVWRASKAARAHIGILPDRLRLFDQLTGAQLLYYTGVLRGLSADEAEARTASLLEAFEVGASADRLVVDYSAGMTKKIALASSLIHSPELLVLDEPFEAIDPVSAGQLTDILFEYVRRGGTVMLSSHSMDLVQRVCDHVAVIVRGEILAEGTVAEVRGDVTLEERFRDIVRGPRQTEGLDWLGISFS